MADGRRKTLLEGDKDLDGQEWKREMGRGGGRPSVESVEGVTAEVSGTPQTALEGCFTSTDTSNNIIDLQTTGSYEMNNSFLIS